LTGSLGKLLDISLGLEYLVLRCKTVLCLTILLEVAMFLIGPVGPTELLLIVLIIVIIFGARKLPELGKSLGEGIKNFRKSIGGSKGKDDTSSSDKPEPMSKD